MFLLKYVLYLQQGAFGKCYEFINSKSNEVYAAKVLPKSRMQRVKVKDTVIKEVEIHKELRHPNVVRIFGHFEDESNIYILLEMCKFKVCMHILFAIIGCNHGIRQNVVY